MQDAKQKRETSDTIVEYCGAFDRDNPDYDKTVTVDQVSCTDLDGTLGIGRYRYAIVICKIKEDFWKFVPVRTLGSQEADRAFREFCSGFLDQFDGDLVNVLVYCDAHRSLIRVCDNYNCTRRHSPPGRPQSNAVVERRIGVALDGLRAYLVTACLPNCFWPFAGSCFAFNHVTTPRKGEVSTYCKVFGEEPTFRFFVSGQLVFYKPAPTIFTQAKTDNPLRPGIFLDYYVNHKGKFTGQYIVCDLEDFVGKSLHHRIGATQFQLKINRTEVVKDPIGAEDRPVFGAIRLVLKILVRQLYN